MTVEECKLDTIAHIETVRKYIKIFTDRLTNRGIEHDHQKLESPEVEIFAECKSKLANLTYGSDEYKLIEIEVSLTVLTYSSFVVRLFLLQMILISLQMKDNWDGRYIRYFLNTYCKSDFTRLYDEAYEKFKADNGSDAVPTTDTSEFNRLKRNGFNAVMVTDNEYHYYKLILYSSSDTEENSRNNVMVILKKSI